MHNTSGDEEFFDAFGDEAQMEAFKARSYYQPMSDDIASRTTWDKNSDVSTRQASHALTRTTTPKPNHLNEIENTLAITGLEGHKDTIPRNLQQILDKLDETGVNTSHHVSHSVSHDVPSSSALKGKQKAESTKETEIDSPAVIQTNNGGVTGKRPHNLPLASSVKSISKIEEANEPGQESTTRASGFTKGSIKNPLHKSFSSSMKKPVFSLLHRKRSIDSEFSRESIKQNNRNTSNFDKLICLQSIDDDKKTSDPATQSTAKKTKSASATWVVKFSPNNKLLATGGNDGILRIFNVSIMDDNVTETASEGDLQILDPNYISLTGHKSDIIDICWYQNSNLVLTSSIDKMVILWNVESRSALKVFEHSDIVPCVAFHPLIDGFFATGCFDKRIRIWDINETKVVDWVHTNDIITALAFSPDKTLLLVGFFKGTIKMYRIDQGKLKFTMEITCKNAFSWGKLNKSGKKVTSIVFTEDYEFLVMTNDSRMRLINLKNLETKVKYKGHTSGKYHIQPSYNFEKELILTGSEDEKVYVWNKVSDYVPQINPIYIGQKSNRNTSYEHFKPFPKANTTCAVWVPFPALQKYKEKMLSIWNDIYVDSLMVLFSSDSRIKVLANLVELEAVQDRKQ